MITFSVSNVIRFFAKNFTTTVIYYEELVLVYKCNFGISKCNFEIYMCEF